MEAETRLSFEAARTAADAVPTRYQPLLTAVVDDPSLSDDEKRRHLSDLREQAAADLEQIRQAYERERERRGAPPPAATDEERHALEDLLRAHHDFLVLLSHLPTDGT
jgi:hypothetical protein